ncbi:hypothetical protein [Kibdelosporangium philippinense]|uniref:hypothetical protein n=1 Tax=Kibdelosporangium philippinense TaxID=211113 RepID=UPI00361BD24D
MIRNVLPVKLSAPIWFPIPNNTDPLGGALCTCRYEPHVAAAAGVAATTATVPTASAESTRAMILLMP